jgi:hypothetical protein
MVELDKKMTVQVKNVCRIQSQDVVLMITNENEIFVYHDCRIPLIMDNYYHIMSLLIAGDVVDIEYAIVTDALNRFYKRIITVEHNKSLQ